MVHCAALGYTRSSSKKNDEKISFFKLPKDAKIKQMWISKLKRVNMPKEQNIHVCHIHFDSDCFKRDLKNEMLGLPTRRILTKGAVPTNFVYSKAQEKRKSSQRLEQKDAALTKRKLIDEAIHNNAEMEHIDIENFLLENSKYCQTEFVVAAPSVRSVETRQKSSM
ncbi:THAP domain-containing protein 1-like [Hydractinia symbiolongicarpus]|uniref:THAP domain-containing protein 1-like n=1 Tax=Hydractinia symbiolongicarpus TaxID=13093 RepID=UPI0025514A84|nr:THAP domain-containing protein 1-like [Hydractinia symbiolongicarpus]